jgi:hypothetical protein
MQWRLLVLFRILLTCKGPLTHVAAEHGTMRRCVTMLLHRFLAAESLLAFGAHVSTAKSCVFGACVKPQRGLGRELLGANGTRVRHGKGYLV